VTAAVVVAVGREVDRVPVELDRWRDVRDRTAAVVNRSGVLFTRDALGHGEWDGRSEESVTVAGEVPAFEVARLLRAADSLRVWHRQDAVAVTVGVTVLVGEDDGVIPVSERLRALADELAQEGL
jgi:pimeloyl-ACP methyl ester carboxylesterase